MGAVSGVSQAPQVVPESVANAKPGVPPPREQHPSTRAISSSLSEMKGARAFIPDEVWARVCQRVLALTLTLTLTDI